MLSGGTADGHLPAERVSVPAKPDRPTANLGGDVAGTAITAEDNPGVIKSAAISQGLS